MRDAVWRARRIVAAEGTGGTALQRVAEGVTRSAGLQPGRSRAGRRTSPPKHPKHPIRQSQAVASRLSVAPPRAKTRVLHPGTPLGERVPL